MGTSVGNDLPLAPQLVISMATQLVCSALTLKVANTEMTLRFFPSSPAMSSARAHKNGRLEEERVHVTPIEARSPGKIIQPY